ncbi:MAG TPA: Zn-ribbon domain-containing OB-fold protein [Noviherbaspirillum sp.]|nr:Zn-ribbon domain-containing OB-fold protein [Noviherbaspirillum sp.]
MSTEKTATAAAPARPVPRESAYVDTRPFWEGAQQGKLMMQYCTVARKFQHYPRPVSIFTGRRTLEWREVSGNGVIYAFTTVRIPGPGLDGRLPLCVATVELDEGVRMIANILDCAPEQLAVGKKVRLAWDTLGEGKKYPAFVLA